MTSGNRKPYTNLEKEQRPAAVAVFDFVEMLAWSVFAVILLFTFAIRLCRVDGPSMENTLFDKQNLLLYSVAYTPKQDDIVVFHLTNDGYQKALVKRVIAVGGQTVEIDTKAKTVTVDGKVYEDSHVTLKNPTDLYRIAGLFSYDFDEKTGIFKATVPEHHVFVMGDNRNNSKDSRNPEIGFVDERCILGKAVLRIAPFTVFN